jgi:hypothetical protein
MQLLLIEDVELLSTDFIENRFIAEIPQAVWGSFGLHSSKNTDHFPLKRKGLKLLLSSPSFQGQKPGNTSLLSSLCKTEAGKYQSPLSL